MNQKRGAGCGKSRVIELAVKRDSLQKPCTYYTCYENSNMRDFISHIDLSHFRLMAMRKTLLAGQRARNDCAFVSRVHSICPTDLYSTLKPLT